MLRLSVEDQAGLPKMHQFAKLEVTLGRLPDNDIPLHGGRVSKHHATIKYDSRRRIYLVLDHASTNGVLVNGVRIDGERILTPGDKIDVGGCTIEVAIESRQDGEAQPNNSRAKSQHRQLDTDYEEAATTNDVPGFGDGTDPLLDDIDAFLAADRSGGRERAGSTQEQALAGYLRRYVVWDEEHRVGIAGQVCRCGECLLCRSRAVLGFVEE